MNEILLYLTLKYSGQWISIYDSLKAKERISKEDLDNVTNKIDCHYISLLDDDYPDGWKDVYKPPFCVFCYGNIDLMKKKPIVTIYGDLDEENKNYLDCIVENGGHLLWPDLSNRQMIDVLKTYKRNNLFWLPELKNEQNKTYHNILQDQDVLDNNLFYSELWTMDKDTDYTQQMQERLYLGLSKYVLVLSKLNSKTLLSLASYASMEDVKIIIKKELFEDRMRKIFSKCKLWMIDSKQEILDYFFDN